MREQIQNLHDLLLARVDELVAELLPGARRVGREYRAGSVKGEKGSSLALDPATGLWIDHDPAAPEPRQGNLLTLVQAALGLSPAEARRWAWNWLGLPGEPPRPLRSRKAAGGRGGVEVRPQPPASPRPPLSPAEYLRRFEPRNEEGNPLPPPSPDTLRKYESALRRSEAALAYLRSRGLDDRPIRRFHLGLAGVDGSFRDALAYPLMGPDGEPRNRFFYYEVPGLTQGARGKGWGRGSPTTYWVTPAAGPSGFRRALLVCEGAKDGWILWQKLQGLPPWEELAIITSTHGSAIPKQWEDPLFWAPWEEVYLGQDRDEAGEETARKVAALAGRPVRRLRVPEGMGKDWTDYFAAGGTPEGFLLLLSEAEPWSPVPEDLGSRAPEDLGYYRVDPVDINRAFVGGKLYYPVRLQRSLPGEEGTRVRWETVVVSSEGEILSWGYLPAPQGTPKEDRVVALQDGTVLREPPRAPINDTWRWPSIQAFLEARAQGRSALSRSPGALAHLVETHLRQVVLPFREDYALLTLVVMASYVQAVFDAVPLVLVVGPPGSGKSELAAAMASVSANGVLVNGQTSPATAIRLVDASRGLVAFDDLEGIAARGKEADYSELVQMLKTSYKRSTAMKEWTDPRSFTVRRLNFFGIKVVTNTQGTDEILGSRMFVIRTRRLPKGAERGMGLPQEELARLRDDLHTWAMETASQLHAIYRERYSRHVRRLDEIAAPLRAIADAVGSEELKARLERALEVQEGLSRLPTSDVDVVYMAVKELVRQGYRDVVAVQHIMLEARRLVGSTWGKEREGEIPRWQQPRWVGQILRNHGIAGSGVEARPRLWGYQLRLVRLEPSFVQEALEEFRKEGIEPETALREPLAFCLETPCTECGFLHFCDIRPYKEKRAGAYQEMKGSARERRLEEEWQEVKEALGNGEGGTLGTQEPEGPGGEALEGPRA